MAINAQKNKQHQKITFLFGPVRPVVVIDIIVVLLVTFRLVVSVVTSDDPGTEGRKRCQIPAPAQSFPFSGADLSTEIIS